MKITDFPETVGKLIRKNAEMDGKNLSGAVYMLRRDIANNKKYFPISKLEFKVKTIESNHYRIMVNDSHFQDASSMEDLRARLVNAFDRECIRAGIDQSSPHTKSPPDMAPFKNPRK